MNDFVNRKKLVLAGFQMAVMGRWFRESENVDGRKRLRTMEDALKIVEAESPTLSEEL